MLQGIGDDIGGTLDVQLPSHRRVELARFESTIAGAIKDRSEAVSAKEFVHAAAVLGIQRKDAFADEPPRLVWPNADDLTRVALLEVVQSVVAGDAGDARNQQGQAQSAVVHRKQQHGTKGSPWHSREQERRSALPSL